MIQVYTGFNGELTMGNGKTLTMVNDTYYDYLNGYEIFSNFHIDFMSDYYEIGDLLDILNNHEKVVILTDELSVFSSSYSSNSKESKGLTELVIQLRKKQIKLKVTAQVYNMVPAFLRRLGGDIFVVEKLHANGSVCLEEDNRNCEYSFHKYKITNNKNKKPRYVIPHLFEINEKNNTFDVYPNFFHNCYDSDQVI